MTNIKHKSRHRAVKRSSSRALVVMTYAEAGKEERKKNVKSLDDVLRWQICDLTLKEHVERRTEIELRDFR